MFKLNRDNCHDKCIQTDLHSICVVAPQLRTPILAHMIEKVETLPNTKQNQKRFAQYLKLDQMYREVQTTGTLT